MHPPPIFHPYPLFIPQKRDKRGWDEGDRDAFLPFYPFLSLKIWRVEFIDKKKAKIVAFVKIRRYKFLNYELNS